MKVGIQKSPNKKVGWSNLAMFPTVQNDGPFLWPSPFPFLNQQRQWKAQQTEQQTGRDVERRLGASDFLTHLGGS